MREGWILDWYVKEIVVIIGLEVCVGLVCGFLFGLMKVLIKSYCFNGFICY